MAITPPTAKASRLLAMKRSGRGMTSGDDVHNGCCVPRRTSTVVGTNATTRASTPARFSSVSSRPVRPLITIRHTPIVIIAPMNRAWTGVW